MIVTLWVAAVVALVVATLYGVDCLIRLAEQVLASRRRARAIATRAQGQADPEERERDIVEAAYDQLESSVRERLERHHRVLLSLAEKENWGLHKDPGAATVLPQWLEVIYVQYVEVLRRRLGDPSAVHRAAQRARQEERQAAEAASPQTYSWPY